MSEIDLQRQINQLEAAYNELKTREGPGVLVSYFATSTKVGWSSYTASNLSYMRVGNLLHVFIDIEGVSNSTTTTATIPFANAAGYSVLNDIWIRDNQSPALGYVIIGNTSKTLTFHPDAAPSAWTNSGNKGVFGQIVIPI